MMITDLPRDLESEILSRVPAKSVHQVRSTCKQWYALFKDPQVILKKNNRVYSVNINFCRIKNSFDPSIEFTGKLKSLNDSSKHDVKISEIFHCDGLLLCNLLGSSRLVVWNPCTRKTWWIQPSNRNIVYKYALGYGKNNDRSCNSYKILRSSVYFNGQSLKLRVMEFEIYEFNSDSWRLLEDVTENNWYTESVGVSLKGNTYWVPYDLAGCKFLLKFDFTRERFERLSFPFKSTYLDRNLLLSVVREDKLSLLLAKSDSDSLKLKIWVTDTKIDEAKDTKIQYFLVADFGKFIMPGPIKSFLFDEEKKMVVCCCRDMANEERNIIYIVGEDIEHECKQVHGEITNGPEDYWPFLLNYVPSLVHIQQASASGDKRKR